MKTTEIIDAVTDAVLATSGLPMVKATFKYYRPLSLSGPAAAVLPALSVAAAETDPTIMTTDNGYEVDDHLMLTWYSGQMGAMTTGAADQKLAADTLQHTALIVATLQALGPGIPALTFQNESTLGKVHYGHIEGGVWAVEIRYVVKHWE